MLTGCRERVQERGVRLIIALPNFVARRHAALDLCGQKLGAGLRHAVAGIHGRAGRTLGRLSDAPLRALLRETRARLEGTAARLESVSPLAVLQRGYAVVSDAAGHPLTSAAKVAPGARLQAALRRWRGGRDRRSPGAPGQTGRSRHSRCAATLRNASSRTIFSRAARE